MSKQLANKLNQCLDETGAPANIRERALILSKMLAISKQQAWNLLEGLQTPDASLLQKIANEFEVEVQWLSD